MKTELPEQLKVLINTSKDNGYPTELEIKSGHIVVVSIKTKDLKEALAITEACREVM